MSTNESRSEQSCKSPMASTSSRTTLSISSSSSTQNPKKYEVFLSFRGEDTRHGFTSHLYDALKRLGIVIFRDDEKLEKGEEIYPYLKEAIEGSQYAVVIISEKFAESKSCLFELSAIMECKRKGRITVFPVFYHVEPSNLRNQRGKVGESFARLKEDPKVDAAEWEIWKASLVQVGNWRVDSFKVNKDPLESCGVVLEEVGDISGWHVQNRDESQIVKEISEKIFAKLIHNSINIDKSLVGIDSQVKEIMELLHLDSGNVHYIGICGMGGIGKTTLAKVIYEIASPKFEANCFIHGIGEKEGLTEFKKQLISTILSKDVACSLVTEYDVDKVLKSRLINKKVLIVLDDVWQRKQIDALAKAEWFGEGSRIIITSRSYDWPCLNEDNIYEVNILSDNAALQLFCSKAFPKCHPEAKLQGLIKEIVNLAKGLPLALEIFGSYLSNKEEHDWQGYLNRLKAYLDLEVKDSLKITFEGLEGYIQDAFLDIVCFLNDHSLNHKKYCLHERLEWLGYPSNILIDLESKSLVKVTKNEKMFGKGQFFVHDLLVQMGQELANQERLWRPNDFIPILQGNAGKIEIDKLKILVLKDFNFKGHRQLTLCIKSFSKMKNLRILSILSSTHLQWCGEWSELKLSDELCCIWWAGYPFESFPVEFSPTNLTEIILEHSEYFKRLSDGYQNFSKLKRIWLWLLPAMEETPDLSQAPYLETLSVGGCDNISSIHPSTGRLKHLKTLSFERCQNLERVPDRLIAESLETLHFSKCLRLKNLPNEISSKSLKVLHLEECSELKSLPDSIDTKCLESFHLSECLKLKILPDIFSEMPLLCHHTIRGSSIKKFPFSFQRWPNLKRFYLQKTHVGKLLVTIVFSKEKKGLTVVFFDSKTSLELPPLFLSSMKCQILHSCILSDEFESCDFIGYDGHIELSKALFSSLKSLLKVSLSNCGLDSISIPKFVDHWPISKLDLSKNVFMKLPDSMCELFKLKKLILNDCTSLQALPKLPLSLRSLELRNCSSLEELNSLVDGVIPSCWYSVKCLDLSNNGFIKLPNSMCELSELEKFVLNNCISLQALPKLPLNLHSLELRNCPSLKELNSLMDEVIPGCWYSIKCLDLGNNGFEKLPDRMCELSNLQELILNNCTSLQTLPKLPLSLHFLELRNCPLLKAYNSLIATQISGEMLRTSVFSSTVAHVGFDCKPHKILYWDPSQNFRFPSKIALVACGPMAEARIPEAEVSKWSVHRSTNSNKRIQIQIPIPIPVVDGHGERTMAMLIFYKLHSCYTRRKRKRNSDELENLNIGADEGNNRILPEFICELQFLDIKESFVFYVPKVTHVGSHGVWVFTKFVGPQRWRRSVSVTVSSESVELKECGIQLLNKDAASKFSQVINHISQPALDSKILAASLDNFLKVTGPIKIRPPLIRRSIRI